MLDGAELARLDPAIELLPYLAVGSVAAHAKVSTAWLYRNKDLRDRIMKLRHTSPAAAGETPQRRQRLSHERVVATLRLRIKMLEETNRDLSEKLETAYGKLALPSSARRLHGNDVRP